MFKPNLLSGLIFLLLFQSMSLAESATAAPNDIVTKIENSQTEPEGTTVPAFLEQFHNYQMQKYTLLLGEDRGACAYRIDPTDVYEQENTRFVIAVVSRGSLGTACSGYFAFQVLQADCDSNVLYSIEQETEGDRRFRSWERFERPLSISDGSLNIETPLDEVAQPPAEVICGLPLSLTSEAGEAAEPLKDDDS